MENIFGLLMFAVLTSIIVRAAWTTYKKTGDNPFMVGLRGGIAVVVTCFLCVFLLSLFLSPYLILFHFYLIPFEFIGGFVFAILYWCLINTLKLELKTVSRGIVGLVIGVLIGLAFGFSATYNPENEIGRTVFIFVTKIIFFSFVSMVSAIATGNRKFK